MRGPHAVDGRGSTSSRSGQAAVLLIVVVAVLAAVTMSGIGRLGANVRDRVHAQSIADAAALASLGGGRGQAAGRVGGPRRDARELVGRSRTGGGDRGRPGRVGVGDGTGLGCSGPGRRPLTGPLTRGVAYTCSREHDRARSRRGPADESRRRPGSDRRRSTSDESDDTATIDDDDLELDPIDVDVPARAQDIDIADDDDVDD